MSIAVCNILLLLLLYSTNLHASKSGFISFFNTCDQGVIQVLNITYFCDSPYTFYYGNGAHRRSDLCDYGDKATISVTLYVSKFIDSKIYMQLSAYDDSNEQLFWKKSIDLCMDYVGEYCNSVGFYQFSKTIQFAYIDGDEIGFVPNWEITFSKSMTGDYDLGAANVKCDNDERYYFNWLNSRANATNFHEHSRNFVHQYAMLWFTCLTLFWLAFLLVKESRHSNEENRSAANSVLLTDQEL
jgi:hypothetical protein